MAQVGIVHLGSGYFREYAIEPGDTLAGICLRYGQRNWNAVYNHAQNAAFRTRYPDPDQIDLVNPVNLFIPLVGGLSGGVSRRGAPIGNYMMARVTSRTNQFLAAVSLRTIAPGASDAGTNAITDANGEILIVNPTAGDWYIGSARYQLMLSANASQAFGVQELGTMPVSNGKPKITTDLKMGLNVVTNIVARRVFLIECPMCGLTYRTVEVSTAGSNNFCPRDLFDLTSIEHDIVASEDTFTSPITGQDPSSSPNDLVCRGTLPQSTPHGLTNIYWDESRFVSPTGGRYALWGQTAGGQSKIAAVIGRAVWGAGSPVMGGNRLYKFQMTPKGASAPYAASGIPSNETNRLRVIFKWMTIHHSTDHPESSFTTATDLQTKFQVQGVEGDPAADIAYHYIIDADGSVYEGRPLGIKGSHTDKFNGGNLGVCVAGDFEYRPENWFMPDTPTAAALSALDNLVEVLAARFGIASVWSHRMRLPQSGSDHSTACPGDNLQGHIEGPLRLKFPGPPL